MHVLSSHRHVNPDIRDFIKSHLNGNGTVSPGLVEQIALKVEQNFPIRGISRMAVRQVLKQGSNGRNGSANGNGFGPKYKRSGRHTMHA